MIPGLIHLILSLWNEEEKNFNRKIHLDYFQVQTGIAVSGLKTCDFVTYTSKGIFVVKINFNANFLGNCCGNSLQNLV